MWKHGIGTLALGLGLVLLATADELVERTKLVGFWKLQGSPGSGLERAWMITSIGAELQMTQIEGDKVVSKFKCATKGGPCEATSDGHKAAISMWYNGAKLVEMETRGSEILKRRFGVLAQGDVMEVETIPIIPSGKSEIYRFQRSIVASASK